MAGGRNPSVRDVRKRNPSVCGISQVKSSQVERDAAPTGLEFLGRGAYVPPSFSPPIPHFMLDATVDLEPHSRTFPLRRKSGAHRLEIGPLLLTYLFSEGTYVSIYDLSPHYGPPSAISIDSRPPLLASGAHSIGFRMVVCFYV